MGIFIFSTRYSWVTIPHAPSLRLTGALTLSAWVRPSALGNLWRTVLMKEHNEMGGVYGLYASSEHTAPAGLLQSAEDGSMLIGEGSLPLNQWSHLALTYDGSMTTLYVNGTQVSQSQMTGDLLDDGGVLRFGGNSIWGEFFSGLIDEVRVYNRIQTAAQIQADMNTPIGAAPAPAQAGLDRASTNTAPSVAKLVTTVDKGASVTTPQLAIWAIDPQGRPTTVEVEVAHQPAKPSKAKLSTAKKLIWSGTTTSRAGVSRQMLQIPSGKLKKGQAARWRARAIAGGETGEWSQWRSLSPDTVRREAAVNSAAANNFVYKRIEPDDCKNESRADLMRAPFPPPTGEVRRGYTKNNFSWCARYKVAMVDRIKDRQGVTKIVGEAEFDQMLIGRTFQGNRDIEIDMITGKFTKIWGPRIPTAVFRFDIDAEPDPDGSCYQVVTNDLPNFYDGNINYWTDRKVSFRFHSPDTGWMPGPNNEELVSTCVISPSWSFVTPCCGKYDGMKPAAVVRCDSADDQIPWYRQGCIFNHLTPSIRLNQSQFPNTYAHISKAYLDPNKTDPPVVTPHVPLTWPIHLLDMHPKHFPGFSRSNPLHRLYWDINRRARNRDRSENLCGRLFFPNWNGQSPFPWGNDVECDEFPFSTTYQGAWVSWQAAPPTDDAGAPYTKGANISVKLIPTTENRDWGGAGVGGLNRFYQHDRILDGDEFFVRLYNSSNNRVNPD